MLICFLLLFLSPLITMLRMTTMMMTMMLTTTMLVFFVVQVVLDVTNAASIISFFLSLTAINEESVRVRVAFIDDGPRR